MTSEVVGIDIFSLPVETCIDAYVFDIDSYQELLKYGEEILKARFDTSMPLLEWPVVVVKGSEEEQVFSLLPKLLLPEENDLLVKPVCTCKIRIIKKRYDTNAVYFSLA